MKFKVWVEIEVVDEHGDTLDTAGDGTYFPVRLPDCLGTFDTVEEAERRQWELVQQYCDDPENSDVRPKEEPR